jgi:hypothetical protein
LLQDRIRQAVYIDYYPQLKTPNFHVHIGTSAPSVCGSVVTDGVSDHCIDAVRQSLMCASDMTPLPNMWSNKHHRLIADFEQPHTCRNFNKLQEWAQQRSPNLPATRNANADRLRSWPWNTPS